MADHLTPDQRSELMASVRQLGTRPELRVRKIATSLGMRYRIAPRHIHGRPDLYFAGARTALFVHGCFWHRHPGCKRASTPTANQAFWLEKFARNVRRDQAVQQALSEAGLRSILIWECETKDTAEIFRKLEDVSTHYKTLKSKATG